MDIKDFFGYSGSKAKVFINNLHAASGLINQAFYWTFTGPFKKKGLRWGSTVDQMVKVGTNSIPIVSVIALFVGIILALQAAYQLRKVGALIYVANLVSVSLTRELAPMLTAIIVAGRSGAAFAAEIGSMKVAEEIDALITMSLNPIKFLVVPRLLAMVVMLPSLTIMADLIGIFGGYTIMVFSLGLNSESYINQTVNGLVLGDIFSGLIKSIAFAFIITIVGCYQGFQVEGGAEGVGRRTTSSVVVSMFLIIAADCFFTTLQYLFTR
jgi:phospholipid/cholesterol/gamma-HCH transport system permease protein